MAYRNFESDQIIVGLPDQRPDHALISALNEGFVITRGAIVDGTFVGCESEAIGKAEAPELEDLFVDGRWETDMLGQLLYPFDMSLIDASTVIAVL